MDNKEILALTGITPSMEDQDLIKMVKDFCAKEVIPTAQEYDEKAEVNWDAYNMAYDMGLVGANLPEEYGGLGLSKVKAMYISQELMYADPGFALTCNGTMLGAQPVLLYGTPEQKKWCIDILTSEKPGRDARWPKKKSGFAAFGLTEPDAGSDAAALKTTAVKSADGSEYVLNGRKCFITNAPLADFFTIAAVTEPGKGYAGISMFLVDAYLPGVSTGAHENKMGIRSNLTSDIILEDVHIPASCLIGKEGMGFVYAMGTLEKGRASIGAYCTGMAERCLDEAVKYAQTRCTKGAPICKQQLILGKIADMQIAVEAMRALGNKVAACIDLGDAAAVRKLGPICKCFCSDTLQKVVTEAVQIFGGYGYMKDYPVEKLMRDAKIMQIFEGTNEIQRTIIGGAAIKERKIG